MYCIHTSSLTLWRTYQWCAYIAFEFLLLLYTLLHKWKRMLRCILNILLGAHLGMQMIYRCFKNIHFCSYILHEERYFNIDVSYHNNLYLLCLNGLCYKHNSNTIIMGLKLSLVLPRHSSWVCSLGTCVQAYA